MFGKLRRFRSRTCPSCITKCRRTQDTFSYAEPRFDRAIGSSRQTTLTKCGMAGGTFDTLRNAS